MQTKPIIKVPVRASVQTNFIMIVIEGVTEGVSMQAGALQQQAFQDNLDSYKDVFRILDEAGLAQLKPSFCEHCVQVSVVFI